MYSLILGQDNGNLSQFYHHVWCEMCHFEQVAALKYIYICFKTTTGADQSRIMQEQMSGAAMAMPADTNKAFKVNSVVLSAEVIKASPSSVAHLCLVISGRVGGAGAD